MNDTPPPARCEWLADAALIGAVALAAVRCVVTFYADWPTSPAPGLTLGPVGLQVSNALAALPLIAALVYRVVARRSVHWAALLLWASAPLVMWAVGGAGASAWPSWWAALALGLAVMHVADAPRRRKLLVGVLGGLLVALSLQAFGQYFYEHRETVELYEADPDAALRAQGIESGSVQQIKYETRLYQREATAGFVTANVLGSALGALVLSAAGVVLALWRSRTRDAAFGVAVLVGLFGVAALGLTFSKGAVLALLLTGGAVSASCWLTRRVPRTWLWRLVAFGLVVAALGGIGLRYAAGPPDDHTGERSLLFRAYYLQASLRMVAAEPVKGVGDFGEAYLKHKNVLNPENVKDPHNVFAMWVASLGVAGWAWSAVLLIWLWRAGRLASANDASDDEPPARRWRLTCAAIAALLVFVPYYLVLLRGHLAHAHNAGEAVALALYVALIPAAGALATCVMVALVGRLPGDPRPLRIGLFAAAAMALLHGQVEMNLTNPMAAPLMCVLLGAAGAVSAGATHAWRSDLVLGITLVFFILFSSIVVLADAHNERQQLRAYQAAIERYREGELTVDQAFELPVGRATNALVTRRVLDEMPAMVEGERRAELVNVLFKTLARYLIADFVGRDRIVQPAELTLFRAAAPLLNDAEAATAEERAEALLADTPYSMTNHLRAADLMWEMSLRERAAGWYERALWIDVQSYLDPDSRMPDADRRRAEQRIAEAGQKTAIP